LRGPFFPGLSGVAAWTQYGTQTGAQSRLSTTITGKTKQDQPEGQVPESELMASMTAFVQLLSARNVECNCH